MNKKYIALTTTGAGLSVPSLAYAHGGGSAGTNLYHYLSSPDHLMIFGALGMVTLAIVVQALRKSKVAARQAKH
tara:strand:- start:9294 stop:9515 length:222 start_codon:yes stop_codon:yes gene_type:complete